MTQRHILSQQEGWWESFTSGNAHLFHWDVPRGSEMWMTVWARGIQHLGQDSLILSQKETCSSWNKEKSIHSLLVSCYNADARTTVGVPASDMGGKLQCSQPFYLWANQSASLLGDAVQHDLLSQHDGTLWSGYCSQPYGGELSWSRFISSLESIYALRFDLQCFV